MNNQVYDNEKWWQDNGFEWLQEIEKRRSTQPLYSIQEIVLTEYFSTLPQGSKVLEFGAGFGRHANYLSELANIEYFAVDQSPTMLDAMKVYTHERIDENHVTLIEPRQPLPYPDNYFDVVYTVSVLIHINPMHIGEIIQELKRVAKHVILHFENKLTDMSTLQFQDHNGCWKHAVQNLYENVQVVNDLSSEQTLYIVPLSQDEGYEFSLNPVLKDRLSIMDQYLTQGLKVLEGEAGWRQEALEKSEAKNRELEGEVGWRQEALEKSEAKNRELEGEVGWRQEALEKSEAKNRELEGEVGWRQEALEKSEAKNRELEGEVGWRQEALEKSETRNQELEGEVGWRQEALEKSEDKNCRIEKELLLKNKELEYYGQRVYDLTNKVTAVEASYQQTLNEKLLLTTQLQAINNELNAIYESNAWKLVQKLKANSALRWSGKKAVGLYKKIKPSKHVHTEDVMQQMNEISYDPIVVSFKEQLHSLQAGDTIAITHKNWLGVKNSTKELYEHVVELQELSNYQQVVELGNAILDKQIKKVIFSGFAAGWNTLCSYLKQYNQDIRIIIFWHGNTTHMYEDYSWVRYQEILQLSKDGHIDCLAFAKKSMFNVYKKMGLKVGLIKNHVEKRVGGPVKSDKVINLEDPIRIGIYSSGGTWNKNAYTQIAAASMFKDATVSMVPYNERMQIFATQLGLKVNGFTGNVDRETLLKEMMKNNINFYITFSECAPLVPLESLNCGVICLTGNNHHYFEGSELKQYLVVDRPDDAEAIYNKALEALKNKDRILELYSEWYEKNRAEAMESAKHI